MHADQRERERYIREREREMLIKETAVWCQLPPSLPVMMNDEGDVYRLITDSRSAVTISSDAH